MRLLLLTLSMLALTGSAGGLAESGSSAGQSEAAKLKCKLAGVHFYGAASGKAHVCFTLTASRKTVREFDSELCPASQSAGTPYGKSKAVAVKANGTFSAIRTFLVAGESGLGFSNVTLSGRIKGNKASGALVMLDDQGHTLKCGWNAHKVSG